MLGWGVWRHSGAGRNPGPGCPFYYETVNISRPLRSSAQRAQRNVYLKGCRQALVGKTPGIVPQRRGPAVFLPDLFAIAGEKLRDVQSHMSRPFFQGGDPGIRFRRFGAHGGVGEANMVKFTQDFKEIHVVNIGR